MGLYPLGFAVEKNDKTHPTYLCVIGKLGFETVRFTRLGVAIASVHTQPHDCSRAVCVKL